MAYCALIYPKRMHLESIFKYFEEILWHFVDKVSLARQQHKEQLKRWGLFDLEKEGKNVLLP